MERTLSQKEVYKLNTAVNFLNNMVHSNVKLESIYEYDSIIGLRNYDNEAFTLVIANETIIAAENGADLAKKIMTEYFDYFLILS